MGYRNSEKRRAYLRAYQLRWVARRREAWLRANGPCRGCGSWERLEVDHIDPSRKVRPSDHAVWSWSEPRRLAELAKCQVLCHDCHQAKTTAYLRRPVVHGRHTAYASGCRCAPCYEAHLAYNRAWRATGKGVAA